MTSQYLLNHFFTHKDFLPPASELAGTLFTPLHLVVSSLCVLLVVGLAMRWGKLTEQQLKRRYAILWVLLVALEVCKILWETLCGQTIRFEWGGILPLYPCSVFMYAMPLVIWGKGTVREAGCGYVCSLGLLGGLINFVYPANVLSNYSCLSFAGFHTLFYHGSLVLCAASMLLSGYHRWTNITRWQQLLIPAIPALAVSVVANLVNFSPIGSDYMFFKLNSFFFAPLGAATPDWLSVIFVYFVYLLIHALPYLPSYFANRKRLKQSA